ncbi:tramtrack [Carabus blaptoides fortunei]
MSSIPNRYSNQQYQPGAPAPSNMSSQRFCLRWNNHQSNLLSVFDQLLHDESFVDVTLAVEGQLLRAHKMVLSACSPYFQALFVNHPDKHPIVILKDVPYSDMKSLLDFMYRGEVSVDQDRLTAFLRVAESLRIKGLTEVNEEKCDIPSITSSLMQNPHHQQNTALNPPPHLHRIQHSHKRFGHMLNPLLGSALMQPKRKRGRPRKLSGSSNGTPGAMGSPAEDFDNRVSGDLLVQGSPEMLEVKMGMDGFGAGGNTSDSSTGGRADAREPEDELKIKEEEPIASTSKDQDTKSQDEFTSGDPATAQKLLTPKSENTSTSQMQPPDTAYFATPENINNNIYNSTSGAGGGGSSGGASTSTMSSAAGTTSAPPLPPPPSGRQPVRKRVRRRTMSTSQDPAEQLTEMSVRGLNLFRYASVNEGVYQCTECAKVDVQKTFKNKYSFQRHAFLYHEGHQRKVFPCPVCAKEFSRPDKMKNHMKTVHDCFMPKDCVFPMGFFLPP